MTDMINKYFFKENNVKSNKIKIREYLLIIE